MSVHALLNPPSHWDDAVLSDVVRAFALDDRFPAPANLFDALIEQLEDPHWSAQLSSRRAEWSRVLRQVRDDPPSGGWIRAAVASSSRAANPVSPRMEAYPLASLFLQRPDSQLRPQAEGLRALALAAVLVSPKSGLSASTADVLRRSIAPGNAQRQFVSSFPKPTHFLEYLPALNRHLEELQSHIDELTSTEAKLASALGRLLTRVVIATGDARSKAIPDAEEPRSLSSSRNHRSGGRRSTPFAIPGAQIDLYLLSAPGAQPDEPPDQFIAVSPELRANEADDPDLPGAAAESSLGQTRYWVARHQRLVPCDTGRFTPFERDSFVGTLQAALHDPNPMTVDAAGVLALVYLTGTPLDRVLEYRLGGATDLVAPDTFRRVVPEPDKAFSPSHELEPYVESRASHVDLPLPGIVADWLNARASGYCGSLLDCLGHSTTDLRQRITEQIECARSNGRYRRVRLQRLTPALGLEIRLATADDVAVHILSGGEGQASPLLAHYLVHYVEYLQALYAEATARLLGES
ncbi:hypothetical protein [Thioalkalivibrio sp. AKL12]|uniref:hypothetical protein n=1 Tax=Thioalkalivibrio sp. AKL12 TaxID=1158159 RepID=UPI0003A46F6A|nr:hypothetical protein [Thioalkalivibrio sp. AKL12]